MMRLAMSFIFSTVARATPTTQLEEIRPTGFILEIASPFTDEAVASGKPIWNRGQSAVMFDFGWRMSNARCACRLRRGSTMSDSELASTKTIVVLPEQLVWRDNPLIPRVQIAVLVGDPTKSELVVMRVKFPTNLKHKPHYHPFSEVATVLSGRAGFGPG